jgi:hypothetical protein
MWGYVHPQIDLLCYIYNITRQNKRIVIRNRESYQKAYIRVQKSSLKNNSMF